MNINSSEYIKNNMQSVDTYKFFGNSPKRKASPSKLNAPIAPIISELPLRRSTRLKSIIYVESFKEKLNSEYDITKENFDSSTVEYEPIKKRKKLTKSSCNIMNEILDRIVVPLDNTVECNDQENSGNQPKIITQEMVDNLIDTIDTSAIFDMLNNCNMGNEYVEKQPATKTSYQNKGEIPDSVTVAKGTLTESYNTNITESIKECQANNCNPKQSKDEEENANPKKKLNSNKEEKTSQDKILHDNNELSNNEAPIQPKKRGRPPNSLKNSTSVIRKYIKVNDKHLDNGSNNDSPVQPKRRGRPPNSLKNSTSVVKKSIQVKYKQLDKDSNNCAPDQPKRRGRPPNSLKNSKEMSKDLQIGSASNVTTRENGAPREERPKSLPKKTGRKAKHKKTGYTEMCKLTKAQIQEFPSKKIPKDRLMNALEIVGNVDHPIWYDRNTSCNPYLFNYWEPRNTLVSDQNAKLRYARQFLLRRDWIGLAKILCFSYSASNNHYPLLSKYAALLLAHTDKVKFHEFVQYLTQVNDISSVMKKCTTIPTKIEK